MAIANLTTNLDKLNLQYRRATPQTQLQVLYFLAKQVHRASKSATPGAFFSQKVQQVLKQIQQLSREDRNQALQEILTSSPTRLSEAYGELDTNMKMAFWYRLANGAWIDFEAAANASADGDREALLTSLESRDSNELIAFFRQAVIN